MTRLTSIVALFSLVVTAAPAWAKKEEKKKPPPAPAALPRADEKAVGELLGDFKWGMTVDEVLASIEKGLQERVQVDIQKTSDVFQQNKLRKGVKEQIRRVRDTQVEFAGRKTGWDVSILEGEFGHKNLESMMEYKDSDPAANKDQSKFFFFHKGKLWKVFVAVNMDLYKDKTFNDFRVAMELRFGKGQQQTKRAADGVERFAWVHWLAGKTYLRAIDLTQFYGTFALGFSDYAAQGQIVASRPKIDMPRAAVEAPSKPPKVADPNEDVVDRITGDKKKEPEETLK